jgi:hypothetical protein
MKTTFRSIAGALVVAAIQSPVPFASFAAEKVSTLAIDTRAVISGMCSDFGENDPTGEYQVGRHLTAGFSGGRDQQVHAEDYYLFVDHLSISLYDTSGRLWGHEAGASGSCHLIGDNLMTHIARVTCSATYGASGRGVMTFDFASDGGAAEVSHPTKSSPNTRRRGAIGIQQFDPNLPIGKAWIR